MFLANNYWSDDTSQQTNEPAALSNAKNVQNERCLLSLRARASMKNQIVLGIMVALSLFNFSFEHIFFRILFHFSPYSSASIPITTTKKK